MPWRGLCSYVVRGSSSRDTPTDLRHPDLRQRPDILAKKLEEIKQEAPFAYKGIGPVVSTLTAAGIARPVAELTPLMTVKG